MRDLILPKPNVVSLLDAFNTIGCRIFGPEWDGGEAAAIRLGQRSRAEPNVRRRGLDVLGAMRFFAENGWLGLIYTDEFGRRVPYSQSAGFWLSGIYPDPMGTGEGLIELDDRQIQPCVVDVSALKQWRFKKPKRSSTGPKRKYTAFAEVCVEFFQSNGIGFINEAVWQYAKDSLQRDDPWPEVDHQDAARAWHDQSQGSL